MPITLRAKGLSAAADAGGGEHRRSGGALDSQR